MTPGILLPPVLPDRFCRVVQPITVRKQRDQFDGVEKLHRVRLWPAQRPQLSRADEDGDIIRRAVQQLRHFTRQQPDQQRSSVCKLTVPFLSTTEADSLVVIAEQAVTDG
jgi:hypothetical protein